MDSVAFLNSLLAQLGEEQDGDAWEIEGDLPRTNDWLFARHPDGRVLQVWINWIRVDGSSYDSLSIQYPLAS